MMGYRQPSDYEPVTPPSRPAPVEVAVQTAASADDWLVPRAPQHDDAAETGAGMPATTVVNNRTTALLKARGHLLSFAGLFLFTIVLYFRPYELFDALSGFNSMAFLIAVPTLVVYFLTQFMLE